MAEGGRAAARSPLAHAPAGDRVLLGADADGAPLFAVLVEGEEPPALPGTAWAGVREAGPRLAAADAAALGLAASLAGWHSTASFHPGTGEPSAMSAAGHARRAPGARATQRPRVDPAVLVLATCGAHALLGRKAAWPPGRYSLLAGFVELGESLEGAAARELEEEAGVVANAEAPPSYWGSAPWPFPASLMVAIGLSVPPGADGAPPPAAPADGELEAVGWFAAADVAAAAAPGAIPSPSGLALPDEASLARGVLRRWAASVLG